MPGVASLQPLPHALKGAVAELCCSFYVGIGLAPPSAPAAATAATTADGADVAAAAGDEIAPRYDEIDLRPAATELVNSLCSWVHYSRRGLYVSLMRIDSILNHGVPLSDVLAAASMIHIHITVPRGLPRGRLCPSGRVRVSFTRRGALPAGLVGAPLTGRIANIDAVRQI